MIIHRAWIGGLATSLVLGLLPSSAEPTHTRALVAPPVAPSELFGGEPGCPAGAEACVGASRVFAGSVVLDAALPGPLALVGEGWGMSYRDARVDISQGIAALGVRGYLARVLWLQAGVGAANGVVSPEADHLAPAMESGIVPAAMFGMGLELDLTESIGLDVSMHAGSAVDDGQMRVFHASFGVGLRWY